MKQPTQEPLGKPRAEYTRRLAARREAAERHRRIERSIGNARLAVFAAGGVIAWSSFAHGALSPWWLIVPAVLFLALVIVHDRVIRARGRAERAVAFYQRGIARLDDRWMGAGETGTRFLDPSHPYAEDLDLFGEGSLFQLLSTARTRAGEAALAAWLKEPAGAGLARARQSAVEELRFRLDLREDLALLGADVVAGVDDEALAPWSTAPPILLSRAARIGAFLVAAAVVTAIGARVILGAGTAFVAATLAVEGIFVWALRARVRRVIAGVDRPCRDLALLSEVLDRFERESFRSDHLARIREDLLTTGEPPSRSIAGLARLIVLLDSRKNQIFAIPAALMMWGTQLAFAIEAWRARVGRAVPGWLAAVGETEALCALSAYAYEHPADSFPEIEDEGSSLEAEGIGHPLIPESRVVRNDIRLGGDRRALIVSGSNMSGKSTLLRTVGVNAVLALAGAPVRARRMRLSPLAIGASIRLLDSLQAGTSRFYAEITRLRLLVDLAGGERPLLFLLDEILHGTNSHDRRIGAEAVVRGFLGKGAIGLITTHDLALAQIADASDGRAANVHFEDHLEDGKISFDYLLRPGVVTKSNALELMRSVGLEV